MVYKPLAEEVALVLGYGWLDPVFLRYLVVVEALGMWESRRDFQEEWEGWKTGFMVFPAFHSSAFPPLSEAEFEAHAVKALTCAYPEYHCIAFRADFSLENQVRRSDLALVHKSFSHWFIVEVELLSHSLMGHVVPQMRCFRYGDPVSSSANLLCDAIPQMDYSRAVSFLHSSRVLFRSL